MSDQPVVPSGPKEVPLERVDRKPLPARRRVRRSLGGVGSLGERGWPVNPTSALMLAGTSVLLLVARSFLTRLAHHFGQHSADLAAKRMFGDRPPARPQTDAEEVTIWMMIRVRRK
jgi:hypothetical protein